MRVLFVCGSRKWEDLHGLWFRLDESQRNDGPFDALVHGDARGADRLARGWAISRGITEHPMPVDWKVENAFQRNDRMVAYLAICRAAGSQVTTFAFRVEGRSNGTDDMIGRLKRAGFTGTLVRSVAIEELVTTSKGEELA